MRLLRVLLSVAAIVQGALLAQGTASLSGRVTDPSGAPIAGALVRLQSLVAGFDRRVETNEDGGFQFTNVPFHTYEILIAKAEFAPVVKTLSLRSNVPVSLPVTLELAGAQASVTVTAERHVLVDPEETGTHTQMNQTDIERLAVSSGSRGLESVLVNFPGFAKNANGAIHPRGAHNQMTFVIDGMPISDQLTGAFANAIDPSIIQTVELFTGNVSAEYGNKTAAVANVTTRSGLGSGRAFAGSAMFGVAQFDTLTHLTQVAGEHGKFGYSASAHLMKSNRYLDQVSLDNLQNGGNSERGFVRFDYQPGLNDMLRLNLISGRSSFQLANLRSQHAALQEQRQLLRDFSTSLGWVHVLNPTTTFDSTASYRTAIAQLLPSAGDTPVTAAQARHLSTVTLSGRLNAVRGAHTLRGGADYQRYPVSENFSFGLTSPGFNVPGSDGYNPALLPHDLSRGGTLFHFSDKDSGSFYSGFVQDQVRLGRWFLALGLRYDNYRFLVHAHQVQPRLGLSFHVQETGTVLRASYNRTFQTPPNENLLISNSTEAGELAPPSVREALGGVVVPIRPERQDIFELGVQQALGGKFSLNAAYHHKRATDQQDNDNFFNTGIIFPITLSRIRVNGAEGRITMLPVRGFSGSVSFTHGRAISTPPFTGGLFLGASAIDALTAGPFVIDHDQLLAIHGNVQYELRNGFWITTSIRYDRGLVSNPSDPAEVAADPDYFDLLPYVNLGSDPPRVRPRTVADLMLGYRRKLNDHGSGWEVNVQVSNVTNKTALYNFQSIFVGTRLIQPRAAGLRFRVYF